MDRICRAQLYHEDNADDPSFPMENAVFDTTRYIEGYSPSLQPPLLHSLIVRVAVAVA